MAAPQRMLRLLQGDVGSGKTVVALLAMLDAVEAGGAGGADGADRDPRAPASRDPRPLCRRGRRIALLTGRDKGRRARRDMLARWPAGRTRSSVGTHALFQDDVVFQDLAWR